MSSVLERHPERDLVCYIDGELSARHRGKVASHLESCGPCRAELEELQNSLAECVSYRNVRAALMPEAPEPWRDIYRDFSRIDESLANTSLLGRLISPLVHSGVPRWAVVAGVAGLIVLLSLNQLRQAPSVQAATLLRKAVEVSQSQPRPVRRIRVRSSRQPEFTRPEFSKLTGAQTALVEVAQAQAVAALFREANWDWNDPLSARSFEQWRDRQVHKTDAVAAVQNPQEPSEHLTQIRTESAEGELAAASITLDTGTYSAVSERLEFRDSQWVELSQIAETPKESAGGFGVAHVEAPVRAAEPPSPPAAFAPGSSASISDELQVLSALSEIGADLGDPVEVNLTGGKVVVSGADVPPRRQDLIRATLANRPNVEVDFSQSGSATLPASTVVAGGSVGKPVASPLESRLEKQLGSHAEFDRFSAQLQDLLEASRERVFALRNLAKKFPLADESRLSAPDLSLLHDLSRKRAAEVAGEIGSLEKILIPTLSSLGGTAATSHTANHTSWQSAADDLSNSAHQVDVLISQMLGMAAGNARPSDLMTALNEFHANLDDCQKALK
jgi:anti-sigma factor RsiW